MTRGAGGGAGRVEIIGVDVILHERGIFRDLLRSDQTVFIEPIADGAGGYTLPRVAVSVRAGDEVLGSVWAAIPEPLRAGHRLVPRLRRAIRRSCESSCPASCPLFTGVSGRKHSS